MVAPVEFDRGMSLVVSNVSTGIRTQIALFSKGAHASVAERAFALYCSATHAPPPLEPWLAAVLSTLLWANMCIALDVSTGIRTQILSLEDCSPGRWTMLTWVRNCVRSGDIMHGGGRVHER